jgi:choline dehydrogenase
LVFGIDKRDAGVQILMLSGIGPADQLTSHNVTPLVDLPGVGDHLMDHPAIHVNLLDKSGHSLGWMRKTAGVNLKAISALFQWTWMGSGPMTTNVSDYSV